MIFKCFYYLWIDLNKFKFKLRKMNSEVIIGGIIIIGISLFFLLPGQILKIVDYPDKKEIITGNVTGNVIADNLNAQESNNIKDSLNVLKTFTYPIFFPIFFIGISTIFVGLRVN